MGTRTREVYIFILSLKNEKRKAPTLDLHLNSWEETDLLENDIAVWKRLFLQEPKRVGVASHRGNSVVGGEADPGGLTGHTTAVIVGARHE